MFKRVLTRKTDGAEGVVVAVVLIIVAVGVCWLFRSSIENTMKNAFSKLDLGIGNLFNKGTV